MRSASAAFRAAVRGSHRPLIRAVLVDAAPQFGANPTGVELPVLGGDVSLTARTEVNATATIIVGPEWWEQVQPYGAEIYLARGVLLDTGPEYVGLGYFRIEEPEQSSAGRAPITINALDRTAQLQQNRLTFPYPVPDGTTHRALFQALINGSSGTATTTYGAYLYTPIPITWTGYDPDTTLIVGDQIVEDDSYAFLRDRAAEQGATLRFDGAGRLSVVPLNIVPTTPVGSVLTGPGGNIVRASRRSSRRGVHNIVTAYGTDPIAPTQFVVAFNPTGPLAWNKATHPAFGPAPRYFDSPLLRSDPAVDDAATALLSRYTGVPTTWEIEMIPDPTVEPGDLVDISYAGITERHVVDTLSLPLGLGPARLTTRALNAVEDDVVIIGGGGGPDDGFGLGGFGEGGFGQ
ncbi:MAG: DUF5047 domain-containing protein [Phycicoccus sp.]